MRSLRQVALPAALERRALVAKNRMVKRIQPVDDASMNAQHGISALRTRPPDMPIASIHTAIGLEERREVPAGLHECLHAFLTPKKLIPPRRRYAHEPSLS